MRSEQAPNEIRHRFYFGSQEIECRVRVGRRKGLRIVVHPDQTVTADAPEGRDISEVLRRIEKRGAWIVRQQFFFEQFMPRQPEKRYVSGESFSYLGRQHRLKVELGRPQAVRLDGPNLRVASLDPEDRIRTKQLVGEWYREQSRRVFADRLVRCHATAKRHGISLPTIVLRRMQRRWGSCKGKGRILLNTELLKAPAYCIDYVIMHELCHLRYASHDDRFSRLLDVMMPDWERRKARLERVVL